MYRNVLLERVKSSLNYQLSRSDEQTIQAMFSARRSLRYFKDLRKKGGANVQTEPVCMALLGYSAGYLQHIDVKCRTESVCLYALRESPYAAIYVPRSIRTEAFHLHVLRKNSYSIKKIERYFQHVCNDESLTEAVIVELLERNANIFTALRQEQITEAVRDAAVRSRGTMIFEIPEGFRTKSLYNLALGLSDQSNLDPINLDQVPEKWLTKSLSVQAVKSRGQQITYVPKQFMDEKIVLLAIEGGPFIYESIPQEYKTYKVSLAALKQDFCALKTMPEAFLFEDEILDQAFKYEELLLNLPYVILTVTKTQDLHNQLKILTRVTDLASVKPVKTIHYNLKKFIMQDAEYRAVDIDCLDAITEELERLSLVDNAWIERCIEIKTNFYSKEVVPQSKHKEISDLTL